MSDLPKIDGCDPIAAGKFLQLHRLRFTDERGRQRSWERVSRVNSSGAVLIVPLIRPDDEFVLVRQFRPPAERYMIEFPAGLIDPGEDAAAAAVRELHEETGFAGEITRVLPAGFSSPGMSSETITTVFVSIDGAQYRNGLPETHQEDSENISVLRVPRRALLDFLLSRIAAGDGIDAKLFAYAGVL